jgi:hypothetical protein
MSEMTEDDPNNLFGFCRGMLDEIEKKFTS